MERRKTLTGLALLERIGRMGKTVMTWGTVQVATTVISRRVTAAVPFEIGLAELILLGVLIMCILNQIVTLLGMKLSMMTQVMTVDTALLY